MDPVHVILPIGPYNLILRTCTQKVFCLAKVGLRDLLWFVDGLGQCGSLEVYHQTQQLVRGLILPSFSRGHCVFFVVNHQSATGPTVCS